MDGNATSSSSRQPNSSSGSATLSPLPPPLPTPGRGYFWAAILSGLLLIVAMADLGLNFYRVPGFDVIRAAGWHFAISLLILVPASVMIWITSCAVIGVMRRLGARHWPGLLQALPAVALVLGLLYLMIRWLFSGPDVG